MQKVLALVGPTAIGKTSLAINLAPKIDAEIVSGDSMQVYREVAIGTAKATPAEQKKVKHYLIDSRSIFQQYSVKDYVDQAQEAIAEIGKHHKLAFLVGGTGFYVNALLNCMQLGERKEAKTSYSEKWLTYLKKYGPEKLWQQLQVRDEEAAAKIPVANHRRTLRALTVIERTGRKFSAQQEKIPPRYDYLIIGLNSERQEIYQRINTRVDQMMKNGLLKEAKYVYDHRQKEYQVLQAIGYKEFFPYFAGQASLPLCIDQLKTNSRRYAKRQLTYFRNKLPVNWFDPLNDPNCEAKILAKVTAWQENIR